MYTQCPDCRTAFRVAADDLRQAAGKVRCGGCGAAFDALLYLSEDLPEPEAGAAPEPLLPELKSESNVERSKLPESISANESIALLQTLDELAGSDVRIEDTGIEWRVLDDVAMSEMGTDEAAADEQPTANDQTAPNAEVRYDDDSPLPDDVATASDTAPDTDSDADSEAANVTEEAVTDPEPQLAVDDIDAAEIDDSGDWEAILDEFDEQAAESDDESREEGPEETGDDSGDAEAIEESPEETGDDSDDDEASEEGSEESDDDSGDDEASEEGSEESDDDSGDDAASDESQDEVSDDIEIVLEGDDEAAAIAAADAADTPEPEPGEPSDEDGSPSQWQLLGEDAEDDSIPTLSEPQMISSGTDAEEALSDDDPEAAEDIGVESIVMEGDSVHFALDDMEAAASLRAAAAKIDFSATQTSISPPKRLARRRGGLVFLMVLLLVALGLQAVHQQRETLARNAVVNNIIGPLYRKIGRPLAPAWDVTGWSFEATTGNVEGDDAQLNIYSRIGNRSDAPLPYPLIGVSLTDRFEEIIGSRVLEPSSYLPSDLNPSKLIAPGESFEAFITVESPDALASGYKLDVCYRLPDRRLRCAIGDFR